VTRAFIRLLDHPQVTRFDRWADDRLEPLRERPGIGAVFRSASHLGDWSLIWHLVGALRAPGGRRSAAESLELSLLLGAESLLVNQGVKRLFRRTRPTTGGDARYRVRTPSTTSFPSGHASSAFFAAGILTRRSRRYAIVWYGLAVVVALSRPFVRIHHASDVIGGALLGAALARVVVPCLGEYGSDQSG
jgi:undecaprenyl-diphosphatase